ncbi:MAG: hypothetical protein AAGA18_13020 [Verrucomicrobiota bacterium]
MVFLVSAMVLAFLSSVEIERLLSRAMLAKVQSDLVAKAGLADAIALLQATDLETSVNTYTEEKVEFKDGLLTAPYLKSIKLDDSGLMIEREFFLSSFLTGDPDIASTKEPKSFDINRRAPGSPYGLLGLQNDDGSRRTVPVQWIYIEDHEGEIVGRYGYWIDDESAKLDLSSIGNTEEDGKHSRTVGASPKEISLESLFGKNGQMVTKALVEAREWLPDALVGTETLKQLLPEVFQDRLISEEIRSHITFYSEADERGSLGLRKINLNDYVETAQDYKSGLGRQEIVDNVIALGDYIIAVLPKFGERYYQSRVSEEDQRRYCIKIAANIYDYIDEDHQPTVIDHDLKFWEPAPDPEEVGEGVPGNPPAVFGKEVVPAIGEYVGAYYPSQGMLRVDHTFEVWNLHTKEINLGGFDDLKILIAERNPFYRELGSASNLQIMGQVPGTPGNAPLQISLSSLGVIPAGQYSLLTSVPLKGQFLKDEGWPIVRDAPVIQLPQIEGPYDYEEKHIRMATDAGDSAININTEIVVANEHGYLDIQPRVAQQGAFNYLFKFAYNDAHDKDVSASQAFGNVPPDVGNNSHRCYPLDSADPRSLTEIFPSYSEFSGNSSIAWRRNTVNNKNYTLLGGPSFKVVSDNYSIDTPGYFVPEPVRFSPMNSAEEAVSVIRDGPMKTIGELGFIYDPAVASEGYYSSTAGKTINRGGFRTLSIGSTQGELTGVARLDHVSDENRAFRLAELFTVGESRGKILLNSILRDSHHVPLRAIMQGLRTQKRTEAYADEHNYAAPCDLGLPRGVKLNVEAFVDAIEAYIRKNEQKPFLSLGELGDLPIFNKGRQLLDVHDLEPNKKNNDLLDRAREEIFRHIIGLLTLKGTVYSIYVTAENGKMHKGRFQRDSTTLVRQVVKLKRNYQVQEPLKVRKMPNLLENNRPKSISYEVLKSEFY